MIAAMPWNWRNRVFRDLSNENQMPTKKHTIADDMKTDLG